MSNLRIVRPTAEYLLAMKCMASRAAGYGSKGDRDDIRFLIRHLGLKDETSVLGIVEKYYSPSLVPPKTQFLIQELLAEEQVETIGRGSRFEAMASKRPKSLAEVAAVSRDADTLSFAIRDFLDAFYAEPLSELLSEEPRRLTAILNDDGLADAYLAGIADHLSREGRFKTPAWASGRTAF